MKPSPLIPIVSLVFLVFSARERDSRVRRRQKPFDVSERREFGTVAVRWGWIGRFAVAKVRVRHFENYSCN